MKLKFMLLIVVLLTTLAIYPATAQVPGGDGQCRDAAGAIIPCPDGDGDGVPDHLDACPTQPAEPGTNGCPAAPPPDSDGDGLPDSTDACPTQAGAPGSNGCPASAPPPPQPDQPPVTNPEPTAEQPQQPTFNLPTMLATGECRVATTDSNRVNVRAQASPEAEIVDYLLPQNTYPVYARTADWFMVQTGWVAALVVRLGGQCDDLPTFGEGLLPEFDISIGVDPAAIGMLLPAVQKVREAAARIRTASIVMDIDPIHEFWFFVPDDEGGARETRRIREFKDALLTGFTGGVFITSLIGGGEIGGGEDVLLLPYVDGGFNWYRLPEPDEPAPGTLYVDENGNFVFSPDDEMGDDNDIPFGPELLFGISPGSGPTEALKGQPMTLVNNTNAVQEIELEDVLITSIVYGLPPRATSGRLFVDPATGAMMFEGFDAEGLPFSGYIVIDEEGDLLFVDSSSEEETSLHPMGGWDQKRAQKAFHMLPPENIVPLIELTLGLPEGESAGDPIPTESISFNFDKMSFIYRLFGDGSVLIATPAQ